MKSFRLSRPPCPRGCRSVPSDAKENWLNFQCTLNSWEEPYVFWECISNLVMRNLVDFEHFLSWCLVVRMGISDHVLPR